MLCSRKKSEVFYEKALQLFPGGVNSPVRAFVGLGLTPLIVARGKGAIIWDIDDNSYIDFCGSWGALILGHAHLVAIDAARKQLELGSSFGITCEAEATLASLIQKHVPSMEKIRFVSSGTEATMSAVRLARAYTGKSKVIKFEGNYHGHADSFLTGAGSGVSHLPACPGIPPEMVQSTLSLPYNDIETVRRTLEENTDVAAVILEPIAANMGIVPSWYPFLEALREETKKRGIVLIFDEVITGFRCGIKGAQGDYGIIPDLTCLGKVIGGGFPAAAFGGKKEIMDLLAPLGQVYQAGTLSGNPVAMSAGAAVLQEVAESNFYEPLNLRTHLFLEPIYEKIHHEDLPVYLVSRGSMFSLAFGVRQVSSYEDVKKIDKECFSRFFSYLLERGVYISPSPYETHFVSGAHTQEQLAFTQKLILDFLDKL